MIEPEPRKTSFGKRVVVLMLTLLLAMAGIYMWTAGMGDHKTGEVLAIGIMLGLLYTIRGGSLPASVYRLSESHWVGGTGITANDDPSNISAKAYLPILFGAILLAALLYYWVVHVKH